VIVSDAVPAGLSSFVWSGNGQNNVSGAINDIIATVPPGDSVVYTVTATADPSAVGSLANTVIVTGADDTNPNNNNATAIDGLSPKADLGITKTVSDATPNVGDFISYTIIIANAGPSNATGVTVQESLPAGVVLVSANPSEGSYDSGTGVWAVGTVAMGSPETLVIQVRVVSPVAQNNTATISHSDALDPNSANNSASVTETPQQADLTVTKTVDNATPVFGTPVHFTIRVTNEGPDSATNVIVADPLPTGLVLVAVTPSQGSVDSQGVWTVGTLGDGVTAILGITAMTAVDGPIINNAVARADQFDPRLANNQGAVVVTVLLSPDQISKRSFLNSSASDAPVDPATFPLNTQFVAQGYRDLLHREADALGLANWSELLDNGSSRSQVIFEIEGSPEYLGDEVDVAYAQLLHRPADAAGRNGFVNFLENGGTVEQLDTLIAGSAEYFQRRGGSTNAGFLDALYQDGLGRTADAYGLAAWTQTLANGASRAQVADGIFNSAEYDANLVSSCYATFLRRPADSDGLNGWLARLLGGLKDEQVIAGFLASDEYFTRVA
jgi:uncharacterized repeat protein (TIGR01451 family)